MMATRAVLIDASGVVVNAILVGAQYTPPPGLTLIESETAQIGDTYADGQFTSASISQNPPQPDPAPDITPRQLFIGLAREGFISWDEAEAAASSGAVPAAIEALFASLPAQQASEARITWARMSIVERKHPLIALIMAERDISHDQLDAFFRAWAEI